VVIACKTRQAAVDLLRYCIEDGEVVPSKHFRQKLSVEGLTFEDAWLVLKHGNIYDAPEPDMKTAEWMYRIEGHEPGGKWVVVVFCFKTVERAFLITVFSVESRRKRR